MSDPHPATSSCLLESLLDQQYDSSTLETYISSANLLPESWDDFDVEIGGHENAVSQSDSEVDVAKMEGWVGGESRQPQQVRSKKRKFQDVEDSSAALMGVQVSRERQRGKNWEKAEEDILVESKRNEMDWKSISECLKERGFVRNHKHCADKWYALRKHYLEIHQWMADHPSISYWDRSDGERIRSVPPSFCQKWYQIFDAAEKREGRKKVSQSQRRKSDGGGAHQSLAMALRPDSAFRAQQPSCSLSDGLQQHHPGDRFGDASHRIGEDHGLYFSKRAVGPYYNLNIQMLVAEIHSLSSALSLKFDAEEKERARNFDIKERKLELKIQRFDYKRQRDEEKRKTVAQCLNVAVKAYD
jgi:hypothetical protein